ncbi:thermonuclease family protein [Neisseria sp. Ec49-e6-T10]|uniref:thermonuclease family protein n=1 Tax=Neisseria sp. Ec49-e6-T10 TaxID=3140744 RepID=UPI003EB8051F
MMKKLVLISLLFLTFSQAKATSCQVLEVITGDTFKCVTENEKVVTVKLYQIYAPELDQPYGQQAKKILSGLILGQKIRLLEMRPYPDSKENKRFINKGSNNLILAEIHLYSEMKDQFSLYDLINFKILAQGYVWFKNSEPNEHPYEQVEEQARKNKYGLWADPNPIPPWKWRKQKNTVKLISTDQSKSNQICVFSHFRCNLTNLAPDFQTA